VKVARRPGGVCVSVVQNVTPVLLRSLRARLRMSRPLTTCSPEYLNLSPRRQSTFGNLQARTMEGGGGWRYAPGGDLTSTGMLTTRAQNASTLAEARGYSLSRAQRSSGQSSPTQTARLSQQQPPVPDTAQTQTLVFLGSTVGRGQDRSGLYSRAVSRHTKRFAPPTELEILAETRRLATGEIARTDLFAPIVWPLRSPTTPLSGDLSPLAYSARRQALTPNCNPRSAPRSAFSRDGFGGRRGGIEPFTSALQVY